MILTGILPGIASQGQEMLGLVNGNYSGSAGIAINPSYMANSKLRSDISLFTIHSFAENNYFYLPADEASLFKIMNGTYTFPYFEKPYGYGQRNVNSYFMDVSDKNIYLNNKISGPSVMFGLNDHFFAAHMSYRMVSSTTNLPYDIANFSYYAMDYYPQHNIYYERSNYSMATMGWWELGVSYATVLSRPFRTLWSAGITVNYLAGYGGAYVEGRQTDYIVYNDSILNVEYLDGELGISLPVDYVTDDVDYFEDLVRGSGMSLDLGFSVQYRDKPYMRRYSGMYYRKRFEDYRYRVGFAILDVGWITFRDNAEVHSYDGVSNHHVNVEYLEYSSLHDELQAASTLLYGDPDASYRANSFRIYLPMSANLQLDYNLSGPWYMNGSIVVPLPVFKPMIQRPMMVALVPRYESQMLEVSIPVVFYQFFNPRLGLAIRYHGFTIGSDNLGAFFGNRDVTGYDVYVNYKINLTGIKKPYHSRKNPCWFN